MKLSTLQNVIMFLFLAFNQNVVNGQTNKQENQSLTPKQQAIVLTSAFTANGDLGKLKEALHSALNVKLTINETKEVIVHLYAYAGFPRSIRGLQTLMSVLEERKAKGIKDDVGKDATPIPPGTDKYDAGKKTQEKLTGRQQGALSGYNAFSPEIDRFLKEHLFADIFS
ncbi:MAG TPA: carboxymuconolactone decarboxylase family protein, partial [Chryseolinea sp.]|nr:carboxymuconolactone decarboxylase family protein [Chryseolinea sp.]